MKRMFGKQNWLTVGTLCVGMSLPVLADTLYSNTGTDQHYNLNPGTFEVGNQIIMPSPGYVTNFQVGYFGANNNTPGNPFAGNGNPVQARIRFYLNDSGTMVSGLNAPGTKFFDSQWFTIPTTLTTTTTSLLMGFDPSNTAEFAGGGLFTTDRSFTYTIQFQGMGTGDEASVPLYGPPTVGDGYDNFWINDGTELAPIWALNTTTNGIIPNFAASFQATAVPEPSSLALFGLGALGVMSLSRRLRKA